MPRKKTDESTAKPARGGVHPPAERVERFFKPTPPPTPTQRKKLRNLLSKTADRGSQPPNQPASAESLKWFEEHAWWWLWIDPALAMPQNQLSENAKVLTENFGLDQHLLEWLPLTMLRCQQYPAFVYEIAVRIENPDLIPIPWLKLTQDIKGPFIGAFEPNAPLKGVMRIVGNNPPDYEPDEPYWSQPFSWENARFNLLFNDTALIEIFSEFIRNERRLNGIPAPTPNKGRKNRPFSWLPIQLMDQRRFQNKTLNESERSNVSKACREVRKLLGIKAAR